MTAMVHDSFGAHGDIARAVVPALASLLDDPQAHQIGAAVAFFLEAIAYETLNDPDATGRALRLAPATWSSLTARHGCCIT